MASKIDGILAAQLIQEYRKQNSSPGGFGLKTHEGHHLHGFFISREALESMLKNPDVTGISISFAKHPDHKGSADKVLTVVLGGVEPAPAGSSTPLVCKGEVYGDPPPCPPYCSVVEPGSNP